MRAAARTTLIALVLVAVTTPGALAITITFSSGTRAGSVVFEQSGSELIVTLANTSTDDVVQPDQLLNAVFFDLAGSPVLTPVSAVLAPGSIVLFDTAPAGGVVGGEWAYNAGLTITPGGTAQGIGSAGYDVFGKDERFPGPDLDWPESPDGMNYGLTSAGDIPTSGETPVTGPNPLIQNSVVFTLGGLPTGFDPALDVSNVWFQYGTELTDPHFPSTVIPEPLTATGMLLGVAGLTRYLRRRSR